MHTIEVSRAEVEERSHSIDERPCDSTILRPYVILDEPGLWATQIVRAAGHLTEPAPQLIGLARSGSDMRSRNGNRPSSGGA
jgi:hypothetical protein